MATTTNYSFNKPTVGGSTNSWGTDLNANWDSIDSTLHNALTGASAITPNLTAGSWKVSGTAITSTAAQVNYLTGVTSAIQTQIDAKAATAGSSSQAFSASTLNATTVDLGDWTITQSGSDLKFSYQGTDRLKLTSDGALTVENNITAYGSA
jgi:hypothetical protein